MLTGKDKFMAGLILMNFMASVSNYKLREENSVLRTRLDMYRKDLTYLVDLMNRKEITLDEFDMIALNKVEVRVRKENMG